MIDAYKPSAHDEIALARHEMLGAGAWAVGFYVTNALVDTKAAGTPQQVFASMGGINTGQPGNITSFNAQAIGDNYDFPWANAVDFVDGVKASIEANRTLIGAQNV